MVRRPRRVRVVVEPDLAFVIDVSPGPAGGHTATIVEAPAGLGAAPAPVDVAHRGDRLFWQEGPTCLQATVERQRPDAPERESRVVHLRGISLACEVGPARAGRKGAAPAGASAGASGGKAGEITAQMPGRVVKVLVKPGDTVAEGQGVIVLEAMKMENELRAGQAGRVTHVAVSEGAAVERGALLLSIERDR